MKFDLKRPCANCPFRTDCRKGWLGKARATEIAKTLQQDSTFACHKTTEATGQTDDEKKQHCAGALLTLDKDPHLGGAYANLAVRLAARLLGFRREQLDQKAPVFNSFQDFIKHHA